MRSLSDLRERRHPEITLADEARVKGFRQEVERHNCTRNRIYQLLKNLGEPLAVAPR